MIKYLVVGGGSMGKRRVRCLRSIGVEPSAIRVVDTRADRRAEVSDSLGVQCYDSLDRGIEWGPDAAIVSVPGACHIEVCLAAARSGVNVFCEVPLAVELEGLDELAATARDAGLLIAPGCQAAFHPVMHKAREWVRDPAFGRTLIYHEQFGQYLPDWHPYEDYRAFYAADLGMGGGNLDVLAQEITIAQWLTGDTLREVSCRSAKLSKLELKAPDLWQVLGTSHDGAAYTLQFDVIQRAPYCARRIVSEDGTVEMADGVVRRYLARNAAWECFSPPEGFSYETCYIDEIRCFDACIKRGGVWPISLEDAIHTVRFLVAIRRSDELRRAVDMTGGVAAW